MTATTSHEVPPAQALEQAILRRAQELAEEQREQGRRAAAQIEAECHARLRQLQEREAKAAQTVADRTYHRTVQGVTLQLQAEIDRARWALVDGTLAQLRSLWQGLLDDDTRYLPLFHHLLREAAQAVERDELIAEVNTRDYHRLHSRWSAIAAMIAPTKTIHLAIMPPPECVGGVVLYSVDRRIRVDNTFEGRSQQLADALRQVVLSRLLPASASHN